MKKDFTYEITILKEYTESDIYHIESIEKSCFSDPWSFNSIKESLENPSYKYIISKSNNIILGYMNINTILDEGYINNFAVNKQYQNLGIGNAILKKAINFGKENNLSFLSLEVRSSNNKAISLYKKNNFLITGSRKSFYTKPVEDALIMTHYYNKKSERKSH